MKFCNNVILPVRCVVAQRRAHTASLPPAERQPTLGCAVGAALLRGVDATHGQLCCTHSSGQLRFGWRPHCCVSSYFPQVHRRSIHGGRSGGHEMDFQWARSTKLLAVLLAIAIVVVGVLTALVMHQRHDLSTANGQVRLGTAPAAPGASVPAGADIVANPKAATPPDPAATADSANPPAGPASQPAPVFPAPPLDLVAQAPPAAPAS